MKTDMIFMLFCQTNGQQIFTVTVTKHNLVLLSDLIM